jgi:hypothetical protein
MRDRGAPMSGFTLYETLRILVPGLLATVLLNIGLRLGLGVSPIQADGGAKEVVEALQSPLGSVTVAVAIGLLLYIVDLPSKTRLFKEGDPDHRFRLPSTALAEHLNRTGLGEFPKNLSLYFLLSDRYLPAELHRRVYLFGSLYRVYVDFRALLGLTLAAGVGTALVSASSSEAFDTLPRFDSPVALAFFASLGGLILIGIPGIAAHGLTVRRKYGVGEFRRRLASDAASISWCAAATAAGSLLSAQFLIRQNVILRLLGGALAIAAFLLWTWVEIGPPAPLAQPPTTPPAENEAQPRDLSPEAAARSTPPDMRSRVLRALGAHSPYVQYTPIQRLICDLALFAPWLVMSSVAHQGRVAPVASVLAWGTLAGLSTAIMSLRKHEQRQLQTYEGQSLWLDLHLDDIRRIGRDLRLPDQWG